MRNTTALIMLALGSAGCATVQPTASPGAVATGFQPGVTTIDQVEARLGAPYSVSRTADASTILAYRFAPGRSGGSSRPTSTGDIDTNPGVVVLHFDKSATFVGSTLTQSTASAGLFGPK